MYPLSNQGNEYGNTLEGGEWVGVWVEVAWEEEGERGEKGREGRGGRCEVGGGRWGGSEKADTTGCLSNVRAPDN